MTQHDYNKASTTDQDIFDGLLFIPDISGFTALVHSTDVLTGRQITFELPSAVISQNELQLEMAEVEGDAILFYRRGVAPSLCKLADQFEKMSAAFEHKKNELQERLSLPLDLSLKVIAHYRPMTEYIIGPFTKLYGQVVVEAHRLLKNSIEAENYLLVTDLLLETTDTIPDDALLHFWHPLRQTL